jgi:hypothetical protein
LYSISTSPLHHKCYLLNKCMNAWWYSTFLSFSLYKKEKEKK